MKKYSCIIRHLIFALFLILLIAPTLYAQITDEDGDWSKKYESLQNTPEADLMIRTGDIDNLGFGWPLNFNPFSGNNTPRHAYPWAPDTTDPAGTDRIMVITSYKGTPPSGQDGYTTNTSRPENSVRPIRLSYTLNGLEVSGAILQIFVDDFQAGLWKASYQISINNVRAHFMESIINSLMQTGPIGKLISVEIPDEYLYLIENETLDIVFDDFTTGAGDGYAIDFVKLLINPADITQVGSITGTVYDQKSFQPLEGVRVVANGIVTDTTNNEGKYLLENVLAGIVNIRAFKDGYGSETMATELTTASTRTIDLYLKSPAPLITSVMPHDNMYDVSADARIQIQFNDKMDTLTFTSANFILSNIDSSINGHFVRTDSTIEFIAAGPLSDDTDYRAELTTGVRNNAGIALSDNYIWHFSTGGDPTQLEANLTEVPNVSLLEQNYPNPFNPVTYIKFRLPKSEFVRLTIYNLLGEELEVLVSENLISGSHTYQFNGGDLASGIYYFQLAAGNYREVKKMILLR